MTLHTLPLLIRGSIDAGILAGSAVTANEENERNKNISTRGKIIGAVAGAVILVVIIVGAVCYDRRKKRKARQGTQLRDTGAGMDEEAVPMVYGPVGMHRPSMVQPSSEYFPPQGEGMYAGSGYAQGPMHMPAGHQGTEFYRNQ